MQSRRLWSVLALFLLLARMSWAQAAPPVDPHNIESQALSHPLDLTSTWLIHEGDDPRFADPNLDDSHWKVVNTSRPLDTYGIAHPDFLWYRLHLHLPPHPHDLALQLKSFVGSEQIFVNGVLTGPSRAFPAGGLTSRSNTLQSAIPDQPIQSGELTIAIRAEVKASAADQGSTSVGLVRDSSLVLGNAAVLSESTALFYFRQFTSSFINGALSAVALLICIALALTLRREREYFALCFFLAGTMAGQFFQVWSQLHPDSSRWGSGISLVTILAEVEFVRMVLKVPRTRWIVAYEAFVALVILLLQAVSVFGPGQVSQHGLYLVVLVVLGILAIAPIRLGLPFFALWIWRRARNFDALLLSVPLLINGLYLYLGLGRLILYLVHLRKTFLASYNLPLHAFHVELPDVGDFLFLLSLLLFLVIRTVRIARARAELAAEIQAARTVQQLLLARASEPTPGFLVESVYLPANEVGGDFFLFSPSPDGSLVALVGDVSGKGLLAAMRVSMILGVLRRESSRGPATILANLNQALLTQGEMGFTTACCVHLQPDGRFTLANAGHIAPYRNGQEVETEPALPLGLADDQTYPAIESQLAPGEKLVLMSDGVVEARTSKGELLGFERLKALALKPARQIAEAAQLFGQEDDITVLTLACSMLMEEL